jgi:hypothetical protein
VLFYFYYFIIFFILQTLSFSDVLSINNKSIFHVQESRLVKNITKYQNSFSNNKNAAHNYDFSDKQKVKIVAAGDFGCGPVAQSNIKNIESQKIDIFLVIGDLSFEPSSGFWYDMTKTLDSKIKSATGNHEGEEEKRKRGSEGMTTSLLKHHGLASMYYSFNYKNVHILALDTQEFSFNIFKPNDEEEKRDDYITKDDTHDE